MQKTQQRGVGKGDRLVGDQRAAARIDLHVVAANGDLGRLAVDREGIGARHQNLEAVAARADAGINGNGEILNGKALYVHDFGAANYLVADQDQRLYLVDAGAHGLARQPLANIDQTRVSGALEFRDTPATCLSDDADLLATLIDVGRVMLAADSLGAAQCMLDQAVAYAKEREQFNRPIAKFQAVRHMIADLKVRYEVAHQLIYRVAWQLDQGDDPPLVDAAVAKVFVAEASQTNARDCIQIHGGNGYTPEYHVERGLRDAMLGSIGAGTSEVQRSIIARSILDLGF